MFNPTLTNETILAVTYINFPNQIDDRKAISRQALGYPYQGVYGDSNDQIPSVDPGGWGANGPLIFNPGGFDPILFAKKWQISVQDNLTKVWGLHTIKIGAYYEHVTNAQPGNANSNGYIALATWEGGSTGNTFADLLTGGPMDYSESSKNAVNDMHYNLGEALHPGLLEGQAPPDPRLRPPLLVLRAVDRQLGHSAWRPGTRARTRASWPRAPPTRASPTRGRTRARRSPASTAAGST